MTVTEDQDRPPTLEEMREWAYEQRQAHLNLLYDRKRAAEIAEAKLEGIAALHSRRDFAGDGYGWSVCAECRQSWPCATARIVSPEPPAPF